MASFWRRRAITEGGPHSDIATGPGAGRTRASRLARRSRSQRMIHAATESLESRVLLATLPVTDIGARLDIAEATAGGSVASPVIAYNPNDPRKLVSVFQSYEPDSGSNQQIFIRGVYSVDAGSSWAAFDLPENLRDPTMPDDFPPFYGVSAPSLSFDNLGNFYVVYSEFNATLARAGAIVLHKFDFTGAQPVMDSKLNDVVLYRWAGQDPASFPCVVADTTVASFTDPDTKAVQTNALLNLPAGEGRVAGQGAVYVSYSVRHTLADGSQNSAIWVMASQDGARTFSTPVKVNDSKYGDAIDHTAPQMVVSQGSVDGRVPGGQMTIVWNDVTDGLILADRVTAGGRGAYFSAAGGPVVDADTNGTDFTIDVNITDPTFVVSDLDVTINLTHGNLAEVRIELISPQGTTIPLLRNAVDDAGNATNQGMSGVDLGVLNGFSLGTVFDSQAPRVITDGTAGDPHVGRFRPEAGTLNVFNGFAGTSNEISGTWTLRIIDYQAETPPSAPFLRNWSLRFTSDLATGADATVASPLAGALQTPYPTVAPSSPDVGIGPGISIASDNTLGSFSPYQGRLYVAYTTGSGTDTNVAMAVSDNGGSKWRVVNDRINDDNGNRDGFSAGDRSQYQPAVTVDQTTGTVVMTWRDARHDAANARTATYIATSIDGGDTWSPQTYMNLPNTVLDSLTQQPVDLGPIPSNVSNGNPGPQHLLGYGERQGVVAWSGSVHAVFAGNRNAGPLNVIAANARIAAGPRIVSSTMGPVGQWGDAVNPLRQDGPAFVAIDVDFDRPIDPASFTIEDVTVIFRDENTPGSSPGTVVPVGSIHVRNTDPLLYGPANISGATQFRVVLASPQYAVGTYSYMIRPDQTDRIRSVGPRMVARDWQSATISGSTRIFQPSAAQANLPIRAALFPTTSSIIVSGIPANQTVNDVRVTLSIDHPDTSALTVTLISPQGTRITLANGAADMYQRRSFANTRFTDFAAREIDEGTPPYTGTFRPTNMGEPLAQLWGQNPNGVWQLEVSSRSGLGTLQNWSLELQTAVLVTSTQRNYSDQNADGVPGEIPGNGPAGDYYAMPTPAQGTWNGSFFVPPFTADTLPVIVPGPHVINWPWTMPNTRPWIDYENRNGLNLRIPPVGPGGSGVPANDVTTSTIVINDAGNAVVSNLAVTVAIDHTRVSDLVITLVAPDGTSVVLSDRQGEFGRSGFFVTTFEDSALVAIDFGQPPAVTPFNGSFRPQQPLSMLNGKSLNGTWTLTIEDTEGVAGGGGTHTGKLVGWAIQNKDELYLNQTVSHVDVTFDRDMDPSSFTVADLISMDGPIGAINGPRLYNSVDTGTARTLRDGVASPFISELRVFDTYTIGNIEVRMNIQHASNSDLMIVLVAPDGTRVKLVDAGAASGQNFVNTLVTDTSTVAFTAESGPYSRGPGYHPAESLSALIGHQVYGTWELQIFDTVPGNVGQILAWSITATPEVSNFTITPNPLGTDPDPAHPRRYRIGFPAQQLTSSYSIWLAPTIRSEAGDLVDTNLNAGLDMLRGVSSTTLPVVYNSLNVPKTIGGPQPGTVTTSTITINDPFLIENLTVQLDITYPNVPDLQAALIAPNGKVLPLFTNVGAAGTRRNFTGTIFSDWDPAKQQAPTPIQNGAAPFTGRFAPEQPFGAGLISPPNPVANAQGTWTLQISCASSSLRGTLNSWSLSFDRPVPLTGTGEEEADRITHAFRIFTQDPSEPLSHGAWAPVGAAPIADNPHNLEDNRYTGRISAIAVDPSDPSGNTVYVGGASGGIWRTTNFLTTDPMGPTWVPLTDFGSTYSINISSIAIFPRNNDPKQSIIFAATGEGPSGYTFGGTPTLSHSTMGVGFIRSTDGGATWTLLDSTTNADSTGSPLPMANRNHWFLGTTTYKIVVDPRPTPSGEVIVYAAVSDTILTSAQAKGGIYRSLDSGRTWTRVLQGDATDVVLDLGSAHVDAVNNPTGNVNIVYAAIRGQGVFMSPNRGVVWNQLAGGVGNPLIRWQSPPAPQLPWSLPVPVAAPSDTPNGAKGRILLAKPQPTGDPLKDIQLQGWLYVMVIEPSTALNPAGLNGLYLTKDFGQNWTKIHIPLGTNDHLAADHAIFTGEGESASALAVDPVDPNIVYIGGSINRNSAHQLLRVDVTALTDVHAFYFNDNLNDGGAVRGSTGAAVGATGAAYYLNPDRTPVLHLTRDPVAPFVSDSVLYTANINSFSNLGADAHTIPFDDVLAGNDVQRILTMVDPLTGQTRLIVTSGTGIYTGVDADGAYQRTFGTADVVSGFRGGNLQVNQFSYGAVQPSQAAAELAGALFYAAADDFGMPRSQASVLASGDVIWLPEPRAWDPGSRDVYPDPLSRDVAISFTRVGAIATDQTGSGTSYQYIWTATVGTASGFFRVNSISRTMNLLRPGDNLDQDNPVGQWPASGVTFAVNPINGDQIVIGSRAGRVYATTNQGRFWLEIGNPAALDSTMITSLAYGAPEPTDPVGGTNNFIYAGTQGGHIFVTFTGGGSNGNQWTDLSAGLDGTPVVAIITNPMRGSHEAYAITQGNFNVIPPIPPHVYYMPDSRSGGAWQNITGNLNAVSLMGFNEYVLSEPPRPLQLTSIVADWRYVIPDDLNNPAGPTHPALYVAGRGGVFRSLDKGVSWHLFPDPVIDDALRPGGFMPNVLITDLDISQGNVDPTTGRAVHTPGDPDILLATTYGRGSFAIKLSPIIIPGSVTLDPRDDSGVSSSDWISAVTNPRFSGLSEQSAFGNVVRITLLDVTDRNNPVIIGGYDPSDPSTDIPANRTDAAGRFTVRVKDGYFANDGSMDGWHTLGVRATDDSGTVGAIYKFRYFLDTFVLPPDVPDLDWASDTGMSNVDNITNDNTPTFIGTVEPLSLVEIYADGTLVGSGRADINGDYSVTAAILADGTYQITARQIDPEGHISGFSGALTVVIDTVPPTVPSTPDLVDASDTGLSNTDDITYSNPPQLAGTGDAGIPVRILVNGAVSVSTTTDPLGNWTVFLPAPLPDGIYLITAEQEDVAGNISRSAVPLTLTIDTVAPAAPSVPDLDAASDSGISNSDNITNITTPTFIGTAEPLALVEIFASGVLAGAAQADAVGNYAVTLTSPLGDGVYSIFARQTDVAGNVGPLTASMFVIIDTTPPAWSGGAPDLAPASDSGRSNTDNITNITTPTFTGTSSPNIVVWLLVDGVVVGSTVSSSMGQWSITVPNALADGTYQITAAQNDEAGNLSPPSPALTVVIDTVAPAAPAAPDMTDASDTGPSNTDNITADTTPSFAGTVEPDALVELLIGGSVVGSGIADASGNYVATIAPPLSDGKYAIVARQIDIAGNVSPLSPSLTFYIDTAPPAAPSVPDLDAASDSGLSNTDDITNVVLPTFIGTGEPFGEVTIFADGVPVGSGPIDAAGNWSVTITTPLADGAHSITARQMDMFGNIGPMSAPLAIVIDTVPPAAPLTAPDLIDSSDTGASSTDNYTADNTPTFAGSVSPNAGVQIVANGVVVGTGQADGTGTYLVTVSVPLADGVYAITARQTDVAGNASANSPALTVTIDTTPLAPPSVPDLLPSSDTGLADDDDYTSDTTPTFTGTAAANASVELLANGLVVGSAQASAGGVYTITASALPDGVYYFTTRQIDTAGNVSAESAALTVIIDTTPPGTPAATDLLAADDTGVSDTDDLTGVRTPRFVGYVEPRAIVQLFVDGVLAGSASADLGGAYSVTPSGALADGTYQITVRQMDLIGRISAVSAPLTVTIDSTPPAINGRVLSLSAQVSFSGVVATMTELHPPLLADIDWGDGNVSSGLITGAGSDYDISGDHKYVRAGLYDILITVTDLAGNAATGTATADVAQPPVEIAGVNVNAVEWVAFTDVPVATGIGPDSLIGGLVMINWGDGTSASVGRIVQDPATLVYSFLGSHQYRRDGLYTITMTLTPPTGPQVITTSSAVVADAPIALTPVDITAAEGSPFNGTVAILTNGAPGEPASDFTATIDWGDGSITTGTVRADSDDPSRFSVLGTHTYIDGDQIRTVTVNVVDRAGPTASSVGTATVRNVAPAVSLSAPTDALVNMPVAITFGAVDPSSADQAAGFGYVIDWGDGSVDNIAATPGNGATQSLTHAYTASGSYQILVTAIDKDGARSQAAATVNVAAQVSLRNVVINRGSRQRDTIEFISFKLFPPVLSAANLTLANFKLFRNGPTPASLKNARVSYNAATGVITVDMRKVKLADGDYQLQVLPTAGVALPIDFHKLSGDFSGDRYVNARDYAFGDGEIVSRYMGNIIADEAGPLVLIPGKRIQGPTIDFGTVRVGDKVTPIDLIVKNGGKAPIKITQVQTVEHASIYKFAVLAGLWDRQFDGSIKPGQSIRIRIFANPTYDQPLWARLAFTFWTEGKTDYARAFVMIKSDIRP